MSSTNLTPIIARSKPAARILASFIKQLPKKGAQSPDGREELIETVRKKILKDAPRWTLAQRPTLVSLVNIYSDLAKQGWLLRARDQKILGNRPEADPGFDERENKRRQLLASRNEQLRSPSVRQFVHRMEVGHLQGTSRISIFSLMRDGRDLATGLSDVHDVQGLSKVVSPYIQFMEGEEVCQLTGFRLREIWRYFRHTWANPYESIPGRSLMFLVRDAAVRFHPVIGIGALSSAAVGLETRDRYLGWDAEKLLKEVMERPTARFGRWIRETIDTAISEIYSLDFRREGLVPSRLPRSISGRLVAELKGESEKARKIHYRLVEADENKTTVLPSDNQSWEKQANTPLYRSKRAGELASLLELRAAIAPHWLRKTDKVALKSLLKTPAGRDVFAKVVRVAKRRAVGTEIADLTVCGAIPPYNSMLSGKLVALLAASPAAVAEYRRRYSKTPSIIASSIAARAIHRPTNLVFVGTTSLYGVRPNQYDRLSYPAAVTGGAKDQRIQYKFLDERTEGVGTYQFNRATREAILKFVSTTTNGRRVKNIFGEGANPRLRALREGLHALGFDAQELLRHGQRRCIYGAILVSNVRDYLLGLDKRPQYYFSTKTSEEATKAICAWWAEKWALARTKRPDVLESMTAHKLVHPIRHGARVILPELDAEQLSMFDNRGQ